MLAVSLAPGSLEDACCRQLPPVPLDNSNMQWEPGLGAFEHLDDACVAHVFSKLGSRDLATAQQLNRRCRHIAEANALWRWGWVQLLQGWARSSRAAGNASSGC